MATKKTVKKTRKVNSNQKRVVTTKKRKRRRNYSRLYKLIFVFVLILAILITLLLKRNAIALWRKGYSSEERKILLNVDKKELKEYLALDEALDLTNWNEYANKYHYYDYILYQKANPYASYEDSIHYVDTLYDNMNLLEELGYSIDFCREHYVDFSLNDFMTLIKKNYSYDTVMQYLNVNGCQISDLNAYIQSGLDPVQAVLTITYPFIDSGYGTDVTYTIANPKKYDVLIKTGFTLGADYEPDDLVQVNLPLSEEIPSAYLRKKAADALMDMANDAKELGLYIGVRSAYRSYAEQDEVYNYYINLYGYYYAIQLVSVPGSSEHQLGLGVDLTSQSVIDGVHGAFDQSDEYPWVIQNCHNYGFILRYPEDKTYLTGAMNEPWHFRYVGVKAATEIYENNWTLEEYIMNHGFDYDLIRN